MRKMLRVENLEYTSAHFNLGPFNLELGQNEYFVLLGPTGSGKSTFLELISGLRKPTGGKIYLNGRDITCLLPEERNLGFVTQQSLLFPHLNVFENIAFSMRVRRFRKKEIERRIYEVAELIGIKHLLERNIHSLSGGESQLVAIARAIALKPNLLLFDEPMSALDRKVRKKLQPELKKIQRKLGIPAFHVTHDFEEAVVLADRIGIIEKGKILQMGLPEEIFKKPATESIAEFVGVENIFRGKVRRVYEHGEKEANAVFETGNLKFSVISDKEGDAIATLRAGEIILSNENVETSALNNFEGKVIDFYPENTLYRVIVDAGVEFQVLITSLSFERLGIKKGKRIRVIFKASAVHIL